ncbi:MAG: ATP-binding protein, partial [Gammaproteobacteria bacterium]
PSYIQTLVDEDKRNGLFILSGSQQFEVATTINQSLAGRTALLKLLPFSLEELGSHGKGINLNRLLFTGFYPRIWHDNLPPAQALAGYIETYVERDIRQLLAVKDLTLFQRFITLCAGRVGQLLNLNALANDCGVSHQTARNWLTLLEAGFIVFRLPPWFTNVGKRLVKSPKLYFYDVGLASFLLGLENEDHVHRDPLYGSLFENLIVMEVLKHRLHRGLRSNLHFYRDSNGNEVDLLLSFGRDLLPIEIKAGMTVNRDYFKGLDNFAKLFDLPRGAGLLYAGEERQQRGAVKVRPFRDLHELLADV